jgi:[ribosomal protein S5]-alanine N-acetyltransferase
MSEENLQTKSLKLVLQSPEDARAMLEAMPPEQRAQVSPDWLAQLEAFPAANPWVHGFTLVHRASDTVIGTGGFKAPPSSDGMVEIAYGVAPEHQGKGYATEAAEALTAYAFRSGLVRSVRAHTLPEPNASTRVLTKCGFQKIGEVIDPEDGLVWRWEKTME